MGNKVARMDKGHCKLGHDHFLFLSSLITDLCNGFGGKRGVRSVENAGCGKCVENSNFPFHFPIPMRINSV